MKPFYVGPSVWAVQALCFWYSVQGHEWETRRVLEYPEVLSMRARTYTMYPNPYERELPQSDPNPGVYQTSLFVPPEPSSREILACQRVFPVDQLTDSIRHGHLNVRSVSVNVNLVSRLLEFRIELYDMRGLTEEGRRLVDDSGSVTVYRAIPHQCMYFKGDHMAFYLEEKRSARVRSVIVNLSPESFAIFMSSKSAVPPYSVPPGALFDSTFVPGGVCLLATKIRAKPEELVLQASLTELRVKEILGGNKYKLLRLFRWADCRCTPHKLREIAFWVLSQGDQSVVLVHTGRAPGEPDFSRCQVEQLPRVSRSAAARRARERDYDSPLLAP